MSIEIVRWIKGSPDPCHRKRLFYRRMDRIVASEEEKMYIQYEFWIPS